MDAVRQYGWFALAGILVVIGWLGPDGSLLIGGLAAACAACAGVIVRSSRQGILATAALCFGCNAYLFSRKIEGATTPSMCNVNDVINCDIVNTSAASELFGLPITLLGMGFYLGLAVAALYKPESTPRFAQVTALFSSLALAYSVWLAYQASLLGAVCVVCITIYLGTALLLWAAWRALDAPLFDEIGAAMTSTAFLTVAGVFAVVVMVGANSWQTSTDTRPEAVQERLEIDPNSPASMAKLFQRPRGPVTLEGDEPVLGDPNAPYLIVEFADFACPHCAKAAYELKALVQEQRGQVQVRFRPFPLTKACNPAMQHDDGPARCDAAVAAECAGRQKRFWEMSDLLFAHQGQHTPENLTAIARRAGLEMEAWNTCMSDPEALAAVVRDAEAGAAADVRGTPTLFLRGTHGSDFIEVPGGPPAVMLLLDAHRNGMALPAPG